MVKKLSAKEIPYILVAAIVAIIVSGKYYRVWLSNTYNRMVQRENTPHTVKSLLLDGCPDNQILITTPKGKLCRENANQSNWLKIFDTNPAVSSGKEIVYDFLDQGDIQIADAMLEGKQPIQRYDPVEIDYPPTWEEDPYGEQYWRFIYYSLRETRHLLYAFKQTGEEKYKDKLTEIIASFLDDGINKPHAWDDYHAVAFRSMTLVNTWWKLREENALSLELSEKILSSLERHGEFLLNSDHYEPKYNHGISQATALLLLGTNFPDLKDAQNWKTVAKQRISDGIDTLVDNDGSLVENSPYYHFYALEKYWNIYKYYKKIGLEIDSVAQEKLDKMVSYATYILQPNLKVPLLGASLDRQIGNKGVFAEIAKEYPEFEYVLTQGKMGNKPTELSVYYPTTGQVIMRSDWEQKTKYKNEFENQTQVVFDIGPYRTSHSDLDALNMSLFSNGKTLIPDAGLYTYEGSSELKSYFHGTSGHNTVLVDEQDQRLGSPKSGDFKQGDGYTTASAQHDLYPQTIHQRGLALLGHDYVVVVDRLNSSKEHDYLQQFHLAPGSKTETKDESIVVKDEENEQLLTIHQLVSNQEMKVEDSLCSLEYEKAVSCPIVKTKIQGKTGYFVTLIEIGSKSGYLSSEVTFNDKLIVKSLGGVYEMSLSKMEVDFFEHSTAGKKEINNFNLEITDNNGSWELAGDGSDKFVVSESSEHKLDIKPISPDISEDYSMRPYYEASVIGVNDYYSIDQKLHLDIPYKFSTGNIRIYEQEDLLPILGYHHVISDDQNIVNPNLEIHKSDFEKQIAYLTENMGCRWFTFGDIMENYVLKGEKVPRRACVLNFDDGRKDHFTNAYDVFKKYGAVATFYIISERAMNNNNTYMNLVDLDELYRNGNEIGSHTVSAGSLLTDGYSQKGLVHQLEASKIALEEQGYRVTTFAYPKGEWNQNIVNTTKKYYLAGRDTNKDNLWRDMRPITVGFGDDYIWHMHYFKPELLSPEKLSNVVGYNSWWQFEEGYRVDNDIDKDVRVLSSYHPTSSSYGIVELDDIGDRISNKFIVSKDGTYTVEIFGTVNTQNNDIYAQENTIQAYIDGSSVQVDEDPGIGGCMINQGQNYCGYSVTSKLIAGVHTLSVESKTKGVKIDKFKIYRVENPRDHYQIKIVQYQKTSARQYPDQMDIQINHTNIVWYWIKDGINKIWNLFKNSVINSKGV